jgi:hypothetical protein
MAIENLHKKKKKHFILETSLYNFWVCYLMNQPPTEIWRFFLNFGRIMAIENLKKILVFSRSFYFLVSFFLAIYRQGSPKEKRKQGCWWCS